jgi:hypothetical protein
MQYVQLYALQQGATGYAGYKEIDLYPQEPIKLTKSVISVDDITQNKSTFSRTFRVPHTSTNGIFFKSVFNVNAINFDATQRTAAYILVDGATFEVGNVQLINIFRNDSTGKIEYEITFLGTTSAFATEVGPKDMSTLDLSSLSHSFTADNIIKSWTPGATGLLNGDIVYPLAEYGYTYNDQNISEQTTLTKWNGTTSTKGFTNASFPLSILQFKPAIRVKVIWDSIFAGTNFTYTSNFVDNTLNRIYYMGSNYASPFTVPDINFSANTKPGPSLLPAIGFPPNKVPIGAVIENYANAWDPINNWYKVPVSNLTYNFELKFSARVTPNPFFIAPNFNVLLRMTVKRNGVVVQTDDKTVRPDNFMFPGITKNVLFSIGGTTTPTNYPIFTGLNLQQNDLVEFYIINAGSAFDVVTPRTGGTITLTIPTPQTLDPSGFLPQQYKQLEFIKAINDRFKLVWEPDKSNPNNFLIEPYNDWVKGGVQKDWTDKLNENSDLSITPLFYTQPREFIFKDSEEGDLYNKNYQDSYKETFGQYNIDSTIELITGVKEIKSLFSPLPLAPLGLSTKFLIPHFCLDTEAQRQPMQIKPRIGFYNGLVDVPDPTFNWYLDRNGFADLQTQYPLISSFDTYPFNNESFDLNWLNSPQYWDVQNTGFNGRTNQTAFTQYWTNWWESLYDPYSRIMEATFALDVEDVQQLSFNDKIFVKDSWWLVLEIKDFVLNAKNNVRVKLLKLGNLGVNILGESSGLRRYLQQTICYSQNLCDACCCLSYSTPVYTDGETFATSTNVSFDLANQQPASTGYYFDGTNVYYVVQGNIQSSNSCAACVPCGATGLTEFSSVCVGTNFCTVCCCTTPEISAFGNAATLDTSSRVFTSATGGAFTPGIWLKNVGDGSAVQVGPDGTTVVNIALCTSCICNPLEDKSEFVIGTDSTSTCCIQAPNSFGTQSMYTDTGNIDTATAFYFDPYEQFPIGGTGSIYVSNGQEYALVNGATSAATGACVFPATGCTGRNEVVSFNIQNAGPTAGEMNSTYYISFDNTNYFYNGSSYDAGPSYNNTYTPTYATGSYFQYQFTVPTPYAGTTEVKYYKNAVLYLTDTITTPASYNGPNLGPVGPDTWNVDVTSEFA